MPASNNGMGPTNMSALAPARHPARTWRAGITVPPSKASSLGVAGGTGPITLPAASPAPSISARTSPQPCPNPLLRPPPRSSPRPKVIFKPRPEYTAEATRLHIEGVVSVTYPRLSLRRRPGHRSHQRPRPRPRRIRQFAPSRPPAFNPPSTPPGIQSDWDGVVNVAFQLAG